MYILILNVIILVENLLAEAAYEFRVSTVFLKTGTRSAPSDSSEIIRLRAIGSDCTGLKFPDSFNNQKSLPPQRPQPPEYLDLASEINSTTTYNNSLTLCWLPAQSILPVLVRI